jgi:glycogen debranching enzyme
VDLPISAPGAFCYFIEYDDVENPSVRKKSREGYFNVDPVITLPPRKPFFPATSGGVDPDFAASSVLDNTEAGAIVSPGKAKQVPIPLDALAMLSIIAKWQGPMSGWDKHLAEASRRGYNFIHYTPLQERGESGSPYSILDQYKFDHELLTPGSTDGGVEETTKMMLHAKEKYGLGSVTDVVLNHTANNSPWLEEHPEAGESG